MKCLDSRFGGFLDGIGDGDNSGQPAVNAEIHHRLAIFAQFVRGE